MRLPVRFACAFSDVPHHGNPTAVVLLDDLLEEARMQAIAIQWRPRANTGFGASDCC
jgi:predicted PhzF superfamily epimerase YddE/YHI9